MDVGPTTVEFPWLDFHFPVDVGLLLSEVLSQEGADDVDGEVGLDLVQLKRRRLLGSEVTLVE